MTQDLSTLEIVEVRADDPAAVDAAFQVGNEAMLADYPELPPSCRYEHDQRLLVPMPGLARHTFLGHRDGVPVGAVVVDLPLWDNLDKAMFDVSVVPAARRLGVGRALYAHAAAFAREQGRRSALGFSTFHAEGFAQALGLESKLTDVRRRLDLSTVDEAVLDRLYAEGLAKAAGYSVVRWGDRTPDELLADVAALDSSFIDETPMGDLDYEAEKLDANRVRQNEEVRSRHGKRTYNTGVIHDASGRLVAWSAIRKSKTVDWHAWQQITLVHPQHRGHRLGAITKVENLRYLREEAPAVRVIDTFNAEVNSHMIAINEAMGFQRRELWANWQGSIA
ncbi:GNAT family N-acetyltransferase [Dactylosporangium sucinum]|uniref:GNAT family N-acetyltransferase n=1 Tax=Dactylosporangium sucinum TaxID=1424081 RepID=A0A917TQG5_9ACTN|nr:GNAT family N-acetyltransferase [Dactylosporangium sucinum]GGM33347.1 GNAT family N-acetyltransferase [Dactylosporangium sucinum]